MTANDTQLHTITHVHKWHTTSKIKPLHWLWLMQTIAELELENSTHIDTIKGGFKDSGIAGKLTSSEIMLKTISGNSICSYFKMCGGQEIHKESVVLSCCCCKGLVWRHTYKKIKVLSSPMIAKNNVAPKTENRINMDLFFQGGHNIDYTFASQITNIFHMRNISNNKTSYHNWFNFLVF